MRASVIFLFLFGVVFLAIPSFLAAETPKDGNKLDTDKETKEVDDSKYYCRRYGCCHWYGHRCERFCSSPEEAKLMNSDAIPQNSYQVNDMKNPDGKSGGWYGGGGYGGGGHGGGGYGGGGHGGWHGGSGYGGGGHGGGGHGGGGHGEWHGGGGHGKGHGGGCSGGAASEIKPESRCHNTIMDNPCTIKL